MEDKKQTPKEKWKDLRQEINEKLDGVEPGLRHVMKDEKGNLYEKRLINMAEYIARNCFEFNYDQKRYVCKFILFAVKYLNLACHDSDFTWDGIFKIIDTVNGERYDVSTFEILAEKALQYDEIKHDALLLIKMSHSANIGYNFQQIVKNAIMKYQNLFFEDMIEDEYYSEAVVAGEAMIQALKEKTMLVEETQIREKIQSKQKFVLTSTIQMVKNPRYNYAEFTGKELIFDTDVLDSRFAAWTFVDGGYWTTSLVKKIAFLKNGLRIETNNTKYVFHVFEG